MRRGVLVGVVAVVIGLLGSAPAGAVAPTRLAETSASVIEGPRLAGSGRLFYGELGSKRRVFRLAFRGGHRKLASLPLPPSGSSDEEESPGDFSSYSSAIAASGERFAFSEAYASGNARYQVGTARLTHFGGGQTGPFGEVARCNIDGLYGPVSAAIDADGQRVVSTTCGGGIVIRDYSGPEPAVTNIDPGPGRAAGAVAIAGRYLAFSPYPSSPSGISPNITEVRDWVTNTKIYEIPQRMSFDLQDDGTLVTSTGRIDDLDCDDGKLSWYSVAEPTEHVLPVKPCTGEARIAGGRIAVTVAGEGSERVLALVGLDGSRTDVARLGTSEMRRGSTDFDGGEVAYGLAGCGGGANLMTASATEPELAAIPVACPVELHTGSTSLGPTARAAAVTLFCEVGCDGEVAIRMRVKGKLTFVGSRRVRLADTDPCIDGANFEVKLRADAREEIRRRRTVAGHLIMTNRDLDGRPRVTKRKLTLRAAKRDAKRPRACV